LSPDSSVGTETKLLAGW